MCNENVDTWLNAHLDNMNYYELAVNKAYKIFLLSVKCGPGTYFDATTHTCIQCPIGQYTDLDSQTVCKQCPTGSTTDTVGSYNQNMCKSKLN